MGDFTVELQALRDDATTFEAGGDSLQNMVQTIETWGAHIPDWGIMDSAQAPFEQLVDRLSSYCNEGKTEMRSVGKNLRKVADVYESEEEAGVHASENLY